MNSNHNIPIHTAKNIGKTIAKRLNEISMFTLTDLEEMTVLTAYKRMTKKNPEKRLPICYYLYSLQRALMDLYWNNVPKKIKFELRNQLLN